jgi:hypothetical protein
VTNDCIDLQAWREAEKLGSEAIELLKTRAHGIERQLREFIKDKKGISDCLEVDRSKGFSRSERESFAWVEREVATTSAQEAA